MFILKELIKETSENTVQKDIEQTRSRNGLKAAIALSLSCALLIGASFAYFTDYAATSAEGTVGTLSIALESDINLLDAEGRDILNPGDIRSGGFTVTNMGNKSADIRTTIALTAYDREGQPMNLSGSSTTQSEYDLYLASDVEYIEGYGNMPKEGAKPLQTKMVNGNIITYSIPEYSLNGNNDLHDEIETIPAEAAIMPLQDFGDGTGSFDIEVEEEVIPSAPSTPIYAKDCDFVFLFSTDAGNDWQGSMVRIDIIVEAKQHENTGAGWSIVDQENLVAGSLNQSVVLPENVITTNGKINEGYEYTPSTSGNNDYCVLEGRTVGEIKNQSYFDLCEGNFGEGEWQCFSTDEDGYFKVDGLKANTKYTIRFPRPNSIGESYSFTTGDVGSTTKLLITKTNEYYYD